MLLDEAKKEKQSLIEFGFFDAILVKVSNWKNEQDFLVVKDKKELYNLRKLYADWDVKITVNP